jgi:hypothetical protein
VRHGIGVATVAPLPRFSGVSLQDPEAAGGGSRDGLVAPEVFILQRLAVPHLVAFQRGASCRQLGGRAARWQAVRPSHRWIALEHLRLLVAALPGELRHEADLRTVRLDCLYVLLVARAVWLQTRNPHLLHAAGRALLQRRRVHVEHLFRLVRDDRCRCLRVGVRLRMLDLLGGIRPRQVIRCRCVNAD